MKKRKKILIIDNYDSFTYNLVQYLGELGAELSVYRNDKIKVRDIKKKKRSRIIATANTETASKNHIKIKPGSEVWKEWKNLVKKTIMTPYS